MDRCYPGVREAILALCPDIRERSLADEHSTEEGCNWLVAVENYNECYHCKGAHPDFAEGVIDPASYGVLPFGDGKVLVHSSRPARGDGAWYDVSGSDYGSFYLWPATSIQIYPGVRGQQLPLAPAGGGWHPGMPELVFPRRTG